MFCLSNKKKESIAVWKVSHWSTWMFSWCCILYNNHSKNCYYIYFANML